MKKLNDESPEKHSGIARQHTDSKRRFVILFALCSLLFNIFAVLSWTATRSKTNLSQKYLQQFVPPPETVKGILAELHANMAKAPYAKEVRKLDENGNYVSFTGNTIICKFTEEGIARWAVIAQKINSSPLLRKYYAPLPPSSYHMTAFELFHEGPMNQETYWYLLNSLHPLFRSIQDHLEKDPVQPLQAHVDAVVARGIIAVLVKHTPTEEKKLRDFRSWCGHETSLGSNPNYQFHVTLAYMYRAPETQAEVNAIGEEVKKLLPQDLMAEPIPLQPAHVVNYQSMLQFDNI